jgi:serine/threonine-protein kinase RsbW
LRIMDSHDANPDRERLTLESKLSEIARVPPWLESLAARHAIPSRIQFAMDLCLEEVLSNIIRHGYGGESGHEIAIRYQTHREGLLTFVVEDEAPLFNPLTVPHPPVPRSLEDVSRGGQGIHLLKQSADAIEYEPMSNGNRLIISFVAPGSSRAAP